MATKTVGTKSFTTQTATLGRATGLSDFGRSLQQQVTGNLRRATESKLMGITSSALGFLPPVLQASMFGMFSGRSGSSGVMQRSSSGGTMQNSLWMTNLERLFREPLPVVIVTDQLGMLESQREKNATSAKVIGSGTGKDVSSKTPLGFSLDTLAMAGLAGLLASVLARLKKWIEDSGPESWKLPDFGGAEFASDAIATVGVLTLLKRMLFGVGGKGGFFRNAKAWYLKKIKGFEWSKLFSAGSKITMGGKVLSMVGALGSVALGFLPVILDGIAGWAKAEDWKTTNWASVIGNAFGGSGSGTSGALGNSVKLGFAGAAIGSIIPGVGTTIGFIIGSILGAVLGYFGGEKIAKFMDSVAETVDQIFDWENFSNSLLGISYNDKFKFDKRAFGQGEDIYDKKTGDYVGWRNWVMQMHQDDRMGTEYDPSTWEQKHRDEFKKIFGYDASLGLVHDSHLLSKDHPFYAPPPRKKVGGLIMKDGLHYLHSGEMVLDQGSTGALLRSATMFETMERDRGYNMLINPPRPYELTGGDSEKILQNTEKVLSKVIEFVDYQKAEGIAPNTVFAPQQITNNSPVSNDSQVTVINHGTNSHTDLMRPAWA